MIVFATSEFDDNFNSVVKSFDLRDPNVKYVPPKKPFTSWTILKYVLFLLLPIILPLWITIALSVVLTQGTSSRIRVAGILRKAASQIQENPGTLKTLNQNEDAKVSPTISLGSISDSADSQQNGEHNAVDKFLDENVLVPTLDGVYFPGEENIRANDDSESSEDVVIDSECDAYFVNLT